MLALLTVGQWCIVLCVRADVCSFVVSVLCHIAVISQHASRLCCAVVSLTDNYIAVVISCILTLRMLLVHVLQYKLHC